MFTQKDPCSYVNKKVKIQSDPFPQEINKVSVREPFSVIADISYILCDKHTGTRMVKDYMVTFWVTTEASVGLMLMYQYRGGNDKQSVKYTETLVQG